MIVRLARARSESPTNQASSFAMMPNVPRHPWNPASLRTLRAAAHSVNRPCYPQVTRGHGLCSVASNLTLPTHLTVPAPGPSIPLP